VKRWSPTRTRPASAHDVALDPALFGAALFERSPVPVIELTAEEFAGFIRLSNPLLQSLLGDGGESRLIRCERGAILAEHL